MKKPLGRVTSKKELLELQRAFAEIIRRPLDSQSRAKKDRRSDLMIRPSEKLTPHERIQLYAQQYWWRIQASFDEDFPILRNIIGEKKFSILRDRYLFKYPSVNFTLRHLGYRLPEFIKKNPSLSRPHTKKALQSVEFSLARMRAFDAATLPGLTLHDIQSPNFLKRKLSLQPYVQLLELDFDFVAFSRSETDLRSEILSNTQKIVQKKNHKRIIQIPRKKNHIVFHRFEGKLYTKSCSALEFALLKALKKGATLSSLINICVQKHRGDPNQVTDLFQNWVALKWLSLSAQ